MNYTIVTGGSSGLGFSIAAELVRKKMNVIILARNKENIHKATIELKCIDDQVDVLGYAVNIGNEEDVITLFKTIGQKKLILQNLYNVAGIGFYGELEKITNTDIHHVFESNLTGLILMTIHAVKHMKAHIENKCRIINILSTAALGGRKFETIYYAAKWGARGFIESVKDELKGSNIEIMTIYPGGMNTGFWKNIDSGYDFSGFMNPSEVAKNIVDAGLNEKMLISEMTINRRK